MAPSPAPPRKQLPRGKHALAPDEVRKIHRRRLCLALTEAMAANGYAATSVADVLQHAGVSRRSFYELFDGKLDCFLAAFSDAGKVLRKRMLVEGGVRSPEKLATVTDPMALLEIGITAYLRVLADELPFAKLFLVESFAAGPAAIERRGQVQDSIVDLLATLTGVRGPRGRYACVMFVAAVAFRVTPLVAAGDRDAITGLGPGLIEYARDQWKSGAFEEPPTELPSADARPGDLPVVDGVAARVGLGRPVGLVGADADVHLVP
ncbi:MAG: TetR/AcrR family transcriptional regulator, partial [Streptosporangiales bacterium]|nr:TetR/AcrR family transcriptional regulator [Streptosporangiales bacterium]